MQDQMPPRTQYGCRARLVRLASADCLAQGQYGARQVQVVRFLRQYGKALQHIGCCRKPNRFRQIVVNHGTVISVEADITGA